MNIRDCLEYDKTSGNFYWTRKLNKSGLTKVGGPGIKNKDGYIIIGFNKNIQGSPIGVVLYTERCQRIRLITSTDKETITE